MSGEFNVQKTNNQKTIEISPGDLDDIDLDDLSGIEFDKSSDNGSLVFTKEKMDGFENLFQTKKPSPKKEPSPSKKNSHSKPSVQIKKDNAKFTSTPIPKPKKPEIEPNSIDFGLDNLVNQQKKVHKEEKEPSFRANIDNDSDRQSVNLDDVSLNEVKHIMDEKSENSEKSNGSRSSKSSILSDRIREKVQKKHYANENERKEELLYLFGKLEKKGFKLNQKFTMKTPLEEMERVHERLEHERNLKNSIRFQRRVLMGIVSTLEFLNGTMNPFDIELEGWSESIMENQNEYDDIFEELYEKYKDKGKISPEVKLLMTLAGSAFYFHLSKTIIKSGQQQMNQLFGDNAPNLSSMGAGARAGGAGGMGGFMSGLMNNFMNGGGGGDEPSEVPSEKPLKGMKGPKGFDDILSEKSDDIPSIHSSIISNSKPKKRTLHLF